MKAQLERLASSYQTVVVLLAGASALVVQFSEFIQNLITASGLIPEEL